MSVRGRISRPDLAIGVAMVVASWFEVWREEITPAWLAVAGFLVLGAAETTVGVDPAWDRVDVTQGSIYRLRGGSA